MISDLMCAICASVFGLAVWYGAVRFMDDVMGPWLRRMR